MSYVNPSSMYSATIKTSLKNAYDCNQGGAKFNNSAMLNCGLASLVNSLMAVKKLVYDNKKTTLEELKDALQNNREGYEHLRVEA